jgi:hypothetical protein
VAIEVVVSCFADLRIGSRNDIMREYNFVGHRLSFLLDIMRRRLPREFLLGSYDILL